MTIILPRRGFMMRGGAIAAAGLATTIGAQQASAAIGTPKVGPSIFDFGAAGDGITDDSAAFTQALQSAATNGVMVRVPSYTYAIANPIVFSSTMNVGTTWGFECEGAHLISKITQGSDVISLTSNHTVRYFRLAGGITITGSGLDGNGLHLFAPGGAYYLYNATIEGLSVEGVGGHGLLFEGNVFESVITNSFFQDCKKNGATFAQSKGGVCSAISVISSFFNQNGNYGLCATNFDATYGGTTDVRVYGGYCRDNQSYGFYYNNGTAGTTCIEQVGFENNCRSLQPGDPSGAHVYGQSSMFLRNCGGYNEYGGATYLLRGWFSGLTYLDSCAQAAGGAMGATGAAGLVQVNGNSSGHVLMTGCHGNIAVVSGTSCTWEAQNCSGSSPKGALSIKGTASSV